MDSRKFLVFLCSVLALILLVLCVSVVVRQPQPGARAGGAGAPADPRKVIAPADSLSATGMLDRIFGGIPDGDPKGGSSLPAQRTQEPDPSAGTVATATAEASGPEEGAADAAPGAPDGQSEEEKERLRLIRMKDREGGTRRMYGQGEGPALPSSGRTAPARSSARSSGVEDESQVLDRFQAFVEKLHQRAASARSASGRSEGDGPDAAQDGGPGGGRVRITTVDGFKGEKPPTLQLLEKVNQDGADSMMMTDNPELEDGSKDKHGKKFDGNLTTFSTIPIDETQGAFGRREIRVSPPAAVDTGSAPADLKH